jgi:hypothetical protein
VVAAKTAGVVGDLFKAWSMLMISRPLFRLAVFKSTLHC